MIEEISLVVTYHACIYQATIYNWIMEGFYPKFNWIGCEYKIFETGILTFFEPLINEKNMKGLCHMNSLNNFILEQHGLYFEGFVCQDE